MIGFKEEVSHFEDGGAAPPRSRRLESLRRAPGMYGITQILYDSHTHHALITPTTVQRGLPSALNQWRCAPPMLKRRAGS